MNLDKTKFPYQLTDFIDKVNARYDGDPKGDYVMAEHMNNVQEAISRIEEALGIRPDNTLTVEERLEVLSSYRPLSVPQVGYFDYLEYAEKTQMNEMFNQYELIILSNTQNMPTDRDKNIYGYIDTDLGDLSEVQNNINSWKKAGADGIYLNNLNKSTREAEIELVSSVTQEGLNLIVSGDINDLLNNQQTPHNSNQLSIPFPEKTIFLIEGFGYSGELLDTNSIISTLLPLVRLIKDSGHQVMGSSDVRNRKDYKSVHTLALLLSLDYMYWGIPTGAIESQPPYNYSWTTMLGDWRTNSPNLFREGNTLYRYIKNGKIELHGDGEISFPGLSASSDVIQWVTDTVDGAAIKRGSIPADRIKTYNIEEIVRLINESPDHIRIDLTKVRSDDQDSNLPLSIPATHLIDNVIEAINKKNNTNSSETRWIENYAIKSLEASKLTGHIEKEQLAKNTILAINDSSKPFEDVSKLFINVPYADITNIRGTGQAEFGSFSGDTLTVRSAQVTDTFSSVDIDASGIITSPEAEIGRLQVDTLDVTEITGLTNLHVDSITADNMDSLVLSAIEAKISSGTFDSIVAKSLESEVIVSDIISATTSFSELSRNDQAKIKDLIADVLMADYGFFKELTAGNINTDNISISSGNAVMQIIGDSIKVYGAADEENRRNLRVLIGNLKDLDLAVDDYGIVALSEDGETRIFDHTGIYEGGIHEDSITTETLKDDAVTGRKIKYESITVDHLIGGKITGEWIDGETITGDLIAGQTIIADHIDSLSIQTRHLDGEIIEGTHIKGDVIDGGHIKAGAISAEHLRIGYNVNLIKEGMDSFEQYSVGPVHLSDFNIDVDTKIQNEYAYEGNKALRVMSVTNNAALHIGKRIPIDSDSHYGVSAYIRTHQGSPNVELYIGAYLTDGNSGEFVLSDKTEVESTYRRKELIINDTKNYPYLIPVIRFESSNDTILIDAVQIEEVPEDGEISPWRTTSTTFLSGDNITTGTVDAKHIRIGQGTIFGGGDVIDISDTGITARSTNGSASLNSSGLEVIGGAFSLVSGNLLDKTFIVDGQGLSMDSNRVNITMSFDEGFRITDKITDSDLFYVDPKTGRIRMEVESLTVAGQTPATKKDIEDIELTPGPEGRGISKSTVDYRIHDSGTETPVGNWSNTPPPDEQGKYLWTRTINTYTDGEKITTYSVSYYAKDGGKGDTGKGISSTQVLYALHTSGQIAPISGWSRDIPPPEQGKYLWTQTTTTYTDGDTSESYSTSYYADSINTLIDSSEGNFLKNGKGQTILTAIVYKNGQEVDQYNVQDDYTYTYLWTKKDGEGIDSSFGTKEGKRITVNKNDVNGTGVFVLTVKDKNR